MRVGYYIQNYSYTALKDMGVDCHSAHEQQEMEARTNVKAGARHSLLDQKLPRVI